MTTTTNTTTAKRRAPRAETRHVAAMLARASAADLVAGRDWYSRAERFASELAHRHGVSFLQAVGVIAALSPNNRWARNCADADAVCAAWAAGLPPEAVTVCTYGVNLAKACQILRLPAPTQESIAAILLGQTGRKVQAFFLSITGRHDAVCVDGHAYAVWRGQRVPTTKTPKLGARLYETISRAYTLVAARSAELCGEELTPAQVQAVTWVTYRRQLLGLIDQD